MVLSLIYMRSLSCSATLISFALDGNGQYASCLWRPLTPKSLAMSGVGYRLQRFPSSVMSSLPRVIRRRPPSPRKTLVYTNRHIGPCHLHDQQHNHLFYWAKWNGRWNNSAVGIVLVCFFVFLVTDPNQYYTQKRWIFSCKRISSIKIVV